MNNILGKIVTAMVTDKNEKFLFAQKEGITIKVLDKDSSTHDIGEMVEGFVYIDQKEDVVMMTEVPEIHEGTFGWGEVVGVQHDLGVFVDVGWTGKDLAVSMDNLPIFKNVWPRKGDQLYLTPFVDEKSLLWGKLVGVEQLVAEAEKANEEMHNQDVTGTIVAALKAGSYVWLEDNSLGFIHPNERDEEPRLGKSVEGRVVGLREDGVLYLSLLPRAHEVLDEDAAMIFELLKRAENHRIPYHDKSNPDDIREYFGISKGQFKRAVGRLMKSRLVLQDENGTYIIDEVIKKELN